MKERLDQLRAMDGAAFMSLPASSFSPMHKEAVANSAEIAAASSPYTNLNGYLPHAEGERRRKEMLDVATMLEERYRVLLPPDRVRRAPEPVLSESASRSQVQSRDGDDSETDQVSVVGEKFRLRLPARSSTSTTPAPSPAAIKPTIKKARPSTSSKQSSVTRILRTVVPTPSPPPRPRAEVSEASPLSPSPTIDMDISSPEPTPPPPSPIHTVATLLPQTPISNQASVVEPSTPDASLSNRAAKASGIVSEQQNFTSPEQKRPFALPEQELPTTPPDQEMLVTPDEQERPPAPSDQKSANIPEPEKSPTSRNQEMPIHDQDILPEQEKCSTLEPDGRPPSPEPENFIILDQERLPSLPAPDRLPTSLERAKSVAPWRRRSLTPSVRDRLVTPELEKLLPPSERAKSVTPRHRRSLTPLVRDTLVTPEPETLAPPLERERPVAPERSPTPPERERTTTPEPEKLPTPLVSEEPTPLVDVTDQDLQDGLPEKEPYNKKSIEPRMDVGESEKVETRDEMSVRAESEVPAPQNEPEKVDIESEADKMDVEQDGTVGPIPPVVVTEQAAFTDATMDAKQDATPTEQTVLPDVPIPQESADSGPTVAEQADIPVSEAGPKLGQPVTLEQRPRTESVDIEKMPSPTPISSISAPRGRARKRARLDSSVQPNETVSAPVRAPRVPKNHVTYIGASGDLEVTASAIMKAAVHRTQRDVTRHLNAFGVPVPNAIIQMGPPFELPEWVFPPLSPAESEHTHGDFDAIEHLELDPKVSSRQVTPPVQADLKESMELNPDVIDMDSKEPVAADYTASIEVDPVESTIQPTRQAGPKNKRPPPPPPPPEPETDEEDAVSLGDEDT